MERDKKAGLKIEIEKISKRKSERYKETDKKRVIKREQRERKWNGRGESKKNIEEKTIGETTDRYIDYFINE